MSDKTKGKECIITTYFLKTTVQCALVNTKGQYICEHHLKAIGNKSENMIYFFGFNSDMSEMIIKREVYNYCDKNPQHLLLHILSLKMISSLIKLPFYLLSSKMSRNEHLQRKLNPLDLTWSVVRLYKWGISLKSLV